MGVRPFRRKTPHGLPQTARMMADALTVERVTPAEAAQASGRSVEWVEGVAAGEIDPTLDELELALNAIGLELRCGLRPLGRRCHPPHDPVALAERIRQEREADLALFGEARIQRSPPQPGATRRLIGAGPTRRDDGGWAALLVLDRLSLMTVPPVTPLKFAIRARIGWRRMRRLRSGAWVPTAGRLERMLNRNGAELHLRLEAYEYHDDDLHEYWRSDPERYERQRERLHREMMSL